MDIKTMNNAWKVSTLSSTLRLYSKRKEGGQGLVNVTATTQDETTKIPEYIRNMVPNDDLQSECLWQQKTSEEKEEER